MKLWRNKIARLEELCLGWLLLALALIAFSQVVMRYLFHSGFAWGEELSRYLCVLMTFMGAALGVKHGTHFSMDALQRVLPEKWQKLLSRLIHLLAALTYAAVTWYGIIQIKRLLCFDARSPALQIPMSIPYIAIPFFTGLMTLRSLQKVLCRDKIAPQATTSGSDKNDNNQEVSS